MQIATALLMATALSTVPQFELQPHQLFSEAMNKGDIVQIEQSTTRCTALMLSVAESLPEESVETYQLYIATAGKLLNLTTSMRKGNPDLFDASNEAITVDMLGYGEQYSALIIEGKENEEYVLADVTSCITVLTTIERIFSTIEQQE